MNRATFASLLGIALLGAAPVSRRLRIVTYRDTGCGCCESWVALARASGNEVTLHDLPRDERLRRFGLSEPTAGCHTSLVAGYLVEGHIPLEVIARLLRERPRLRGITLPGMPTGIAGMSGPKTQKYAILTLESNPRVYAVV